MLLPSTKLGEKEKKTDVYLFEAQGGIVGMILHNPVRAVCQCWEEEKAISTDHNPKIQKKQ